MTRNRLLAAAVAILLLAGVIALLLMHKGASDADGPDVAPTATITTAVVRSAPVKDLVSAYGVIEADPARMTTLAAPRTVIVARVLVRAGQAVAAGQPLLELTDAPAAALAWRQATDALTFARSDLARVQRLYDQHLAASDQLDAAKKTLADAEAGTAAQRAQGAGRGVQTIAAPTAAIVTSLAVAPGDHLAEDAPLLVLAPRGALSARFGLQPSASPAAVGDAVTLRPVAGGPSLNARLTTVGEVADPTSRTLDATASLGGEALPIGSAVEADIAVSAHEGLLVPRAAVVFDETGAHVFVVQGGAARRVFVTVGLDQGDQIEVSATSPSASLSAGQSVAVQGAYELQDGMAVRLAAR